MGIGAVLKIMAGICSVLFAISAFAVAEDSPSTTLILLVVGVINFVMTFAFAELVDRVCSIEEQMRYLKTYKANVNLWKCKSCGTENPIHADRCQGCGKQK